MLDAAGVAYDLIGDGVSDERAAQFVRSVAGVGPPGQSMWSDDELLEWTADEVAYFGRGVSVVVTGWTLPALLSTRVTGIPLVTEHAGSWVPPVFEHGLLPAPLVPVGIPFERWLRGPSCAGCSTRGWPTSRRTRTASTVPRPGWTSPASPASRRSCSATSRS